jgi:hypothetical protein
MPIYRFSSDTGEGTITAPDTLTDAQIDGVVSGSLSLPGVSVSRGAPAAEPLPLPPREKTWGGFELARPGEPPPMDISDPRAWKEGKKPPMADPLGTMLKKQAPNIVTDAVLGLVGGSGLLRSVGRAALATAAGSGTAALTGADPGEQALTSGLSATVGETLGGAARAVARWGQGALSQTTNKMGKVVGDLVPAFKGQEPRETVARAINGRGMNQLGDAYEQAVDGMLQRHGDPGVLIPAFEHLNLPTTLPASRVNILLKSRGRALFDNSGNMKRGKDTLSESHWLDEAREQFENQLSQMLPAGATTAMAEARNQYARGKLMHRLFQEGHETLTNDQLGSLLQKGRLNEPLLEKTFFRQRGMLDERFTPDENARLEAVIRRGARNPLDLSPESTPTAPRVSVGASLTGTPHPRPHGSLPHAPVRIGTPETVAEMMARLFRLLGAGGTQYMLGDEP